jgi:hypothetical protein
MHYLSQRGLFSILAEQQELNSSRERDGDTSQMQNIIDATYLPRPATLSHPPLYEEGKRVTGLVAVLGPVLGLTPQLWRSLLVSFPH